MHELTSFELIALTLDDIIPNEDTHRYSLHPDFDGLKESISIRGLESPLVVTLNPDSGRVHGSGVNSAGDGERHRLIR